MWSGWGGNGHCQYPEELWFIAQGECPGSAHSTLQFSSKSGEHRSWEKTATEAARIPGGSAITSIYAASTRQPPAPGYSTPQLCSRSGTNTTEKGT